VHQFNHPNISLQGLNAQSLIMVITCSQSATVQMLGQHRTDAALYESFQCYFGKAVAVDRPDARSRLGRNQRRWKANKIFCKLSIWMAITSVRMEIFACPDGLAENTRITFRTRKTWPVRTALAPVRTRMPQNLFLNRFWVSKAYK
jgi:hypothetical protein